MHLISIRQWFIDNKDICSLTISVFALIIYSHHVSKKRSESDKKNI